MDRLLVNVWCDQHQTECKRCEKERGQEKGRERGDKVREEGSEWRRGRGKEEWRIRIKESRTRDKEETEKKKGSQGHNK